MRRIWLYLFIAALLCPSRAWCGSGTYNPVAGNPAELQLKVNIEFVDKPEEWKPLFNAASRLLFDATEKQVKISKVTFYNDCQQVADDSDIRIFQGPSSASTFPDGLGNRGYAIFLSPLHKTVNTDSFRGELGLVHELGHYVFALLDEYRDQNGKIKPSATCVKPATPLKNASIMDGGSGIAEKNKRTEFCVVSTHNTGMTEQDKGRMIKGTLFENKDDWTWIHAWMLFRHKTTLAPPTGPPISDPSGFGDDPVFEVKECKGGLRATVGIDKSGSMSASPAMRHKDMNGVEAPAPKAENAPIKAVKKGADTFLRLLREEDIAGIVEVGGEVDRVPMREMSIDNKFKSLAALPQIRAGGQAGWIELLKETFKQVTEETDGTEGAAPSGNEVIVLLSDGRPGPETSGAAEVSADLLSSIKRRGAVVYAVGVDNEEAAGLRQAVSETGGNYLFARTVTQMNAAAMTLSAQVKSRGIIDAREGRIGAGETTVFRVLVDPATKEKEAYFLLTWSGSGAGLAMRLTDPEGTVVTAQNNQGTAETDSFGTGLKRYWVQHPQFGEWEITLSNPGPSSRDFAFQIHSLARNVTVAAHAEQGVVTYPDPLVLKAAITTDHPVAGVKVTAEVEGPDGKPVPISLFDDGDLEHRDERAGDGLYSNVVPYKSNGTYNVDVYFDSEGGFTVSPGEQGEVFTSKPVDRFKRQARFSVVVQGAPE